MDSITPDVFIDTLFPADLLLPDERPVIACPATFLSRDTGQPVDYYRQTHYRPGVFSGLGSYYFCVSAVRAQRTRQVKKAAADIRTAYVLAVDDIGTKCKYPPVDPSYALETSKANFQLGYLIEPFDVSTAKGAAYYDGCLVALAQAGFNDPGFRSATRLARVPGSLHRSGFEARVARWEPELTWALEDLMEAFKLKPVIRASASRVSAPGAVLNLDEVSDPLLAWLDAQGVAVGHNSDWVYITCPWRKNHTGGAQGHSSTVFSPYDYGRFRDRAFHCSHGHCQGLGIAHFEEWARSQGADITLPGDTTCDLLAQLQIQKNPPPEHH
jgi:hypothetical protein